MLLSELLMRKRRLVTQIEELQDYLEYDRDIDSINDIIDRIFELEGTLQKYILIIDKANNQNEIEIGSNKVLVSTAVRLRQNVKRKIDTLTNLINHGTMSINILDLMGQRATLLEEFIIYDKAISLNDWRTNID